MRSKRYSEKEVLIDLESFRSLRNLTEIPLTSRIISGLSKEYRLTYFDVPYLVEGL